MITECVLIDLEVKFLKEFKEMIITCPVSNNLHWFVKAYRGLSILDTELQGTHSTQNSVVKTFVILLALRIVG